MRETWGERTIEEFLKCLKKEKRLITQIFFDKKLSAWFAVVQDYKRPKPIQQKLF